jgi:hypothetical protein
MLTKLHGTRGNMYQLLLCTIICINIIINITICIRVLELKYQYILITWDHKSEECVREDGYNKRQRHFDS